MNYKQALQDKIDLHEVIRPEGKWYYRNATKSPNQQPHWLECMIDPEKEEVMLRSKRGKFFVYYAPLFNLEYSFRW